jgi:hypothetical protein
LVEDPTCFPTLAQICTQYLGSYVLAAGRCALGNEMIGGTCMHAGQKVTNSTRDTTAFKIFSTLCTRSLRLVVVQARCAVMAGVILK